MTLVATRAPASRQMRTAARSSGPALCASTPTGAQAERWSPSSSRVPPQRQHRLHRRQRQSQPPKQEDAELPIVDDEIRAARDGGDRAAGTFAALTADALGARRPPLLPLAASRENASALCIDVKTAHNKVVVSEGASSYASLHLGKHEKLMGIMLRLEAVQADVSLRFQSMPIVVFVSGLCLFTFVIIRKCSACALPAHNARARTHTRDVKNARDVHAHKYTRSCPAYATFFAAVARPVRILCIRGNPRQTDPKQDTRSVFEVFFFPHAFFRSMSSRGSGSGGRGLTSAAAGGWWAGGDPSGHRPLLTPARSSSSKEYAMGGPWQRGWAPIGLPSCFLCGLLVGMGGPWQWDWAPIGLPSHVCGGRGNGAGFPLGSLFPFCHGGPRQRPGSHWAPFMFPFWAPGLDGWGRFLLGSSFSGLLGGMDGIGLPSCFLSGLLDRMVGPGQPFMFPF